MRAIYRFRIAPGEHVEHDGVVYERTLCVVIADSVQEARHLAKLEFMAMCIRDEMPSEYGVEDGAWVDAVEPEQVFLDNSQVIAAIRLG